MTYTGKLSEVLELLRKVGIAPGLDNEIDGVVGGLVGSVFAVVVMLLDRRWKLEGNSKSEVKTWNKSETYLKNDLENKPENETENKLKNRLENNAQVKPEIKLGIKPLTDLRFRLDVSFFNFLLFFEKSTHQIGTASFHE